MTMQLSTALVSGEATAGATAGMRITSAFASGEGLPIDVSAVGSGGVQIGGAATVVVPALYIESGAGGVQVGGAAAVSTDIPSVYVEVGSGGVQLGGSALHSALYPESASGGVQLGGAAVDVFFIPGEYEETGTGGVLVGGAATVGVTIVTIYTDVGSGGVQVGGTATESFYRPPLSGTFSPINELSASFPALDSTFTALAGSTTTLSASLPTLGVTLSGGMQGLFAELPALQMSVSALVGSTATLSATLPRLEVSAEANTRYQGTVAAALPLFSSTLTARAGSIATLDGVLPRLGSSFTAVVGSAATLSAVLPGLRFTGTAAQRASAVMSASFPRFNSIFYGSAPGQWVASPVMNTRTTAVTQYDLEFNSFAEINGVLYAAGPRGVVELGVGTTDDADAIDAYFTTGWSDYGSPQLKRVSNIYAALVSDGPVTFALEADESPRIEYSMASTDGTLMQRRVTSAKGARGRYWRLHVHNTDGSTFRADEIITPVTNTTRRV